MSKKKRRRTQSVLQKSLIDSVPHSHLFYSLLKGGLHGKVMNVIRNMYAKLTSCVQSSDGILSEVFQCNVGTRQG